MSSNLPDDSSFLKISVTDEWSPLKTAIVHPAGNVFDISDQTTLVSPTEVAKHPESGPVVADRLQKQHAAYLELLKNAGVKLINPTEISKAFCQIFTRDPAFVIGDTLYVSRMRDDYRQPEIAGLVEIRHQIQKVVELTKGVIEGGDIKILREDLIMVGLGDITNQKGYENLKQNVDLDIDVIPISHSALHLDCALSPLPKGDALISPIRLNKKTIDQLQRYFSELTALDNDESLNYLAANLQWLNPEEVASTDKMPKTNALLRKKGYKVHVLPYEQITHLWGSVRCTIGPLLREK